MISRVLELYSRCGKSLLKNGLYEAALPILEVESAIKIFSEDKLLILGGDIYKQVSLDSFEFTYDSWFYDGNNVEESIEKAMSYLSIFHGKQVFIVFVLKNYN